MDTYNHEDIVIPPTKGSILIPKTFTGTGSAVVLGVIPEGAYNYVRMLTDFGNILLVLDSEALRDYKIIGTCRNIKERVEYQIQRLNKLIEEEF